MDIRLLINRLQTKLQVVSWCNQFYNLNTVFRRLVKGSDKRANMDVVKNT
jgi:hypothetical protein